MLDAESVSAAAYRELRERYDALVEQMRQERAAREGITVRGPRWPSLKLSPAEERVLSALYDNQGIVRREYLAQVACKAFEHADDPDNVLCSRIVTLRKKLKPVGVRILCEYGYGYLISDRARDALAKIEGC